jgi:hypothetical protein
MQVVLNVAVSRAQAVAVVACSPKLLWAPCNTVEQMVLVNARCEFADEAGLQLPCIRYDDS